MENISLPNPNPSVSSPTEVPTAVSPSLTTSPSPVTPNIFPKSPVTPLNPNNPPVLPSPKKKMPRIVSILIVLLLLVAGGAFAFKYIQKPAIAPEEPMISPLPVETAMPTVDSSMEGWKTYQNANLGFSLQHPADWSTSHDAPSGSGALILEKKVELVGIDPNCRGGGCHLGDTNKRIFIQFIDMAEMNRDLEFQAGETFEMWVKRYLQEREYLIEQPLETVVETKQVGQLEVASIEQTYPAGKQGTYIIHTPTGKKIFAEMYQNYEANREVFDQIFSTIQPVNSESTDGKFCGGIAGIQCPSGYSCQLDGNYPDAGGACQK